MTPSSPLVRPLVAGDRPPIHRRGRRWVAAAGAALLVAAAVLLLIARPWQPAAAPASLAAGFVPVVVPDHATDGVIAFTIPPGAAVAQQAGVVPYAMPAAIRLRVGDAVVVRNDDTFPHMILNALVEPGATTTLPFAEPGIQAFSSGCTANGGTVNSFTSVIVSARR
jgi:hypothetical protein